MQNRTLELRRFSGLGRQGVLVLLGQTVFGT